MRFLRFSFILKRKSPTSTSCFILKWYSLLKAQMQDETLVLKRSVYQIGLPDMPSLPYGSNSNKNYIFFNYFLSVLIYFYHYPPTSHHPCGLSTQAKNNTYQTTLSNIQDQREGQESLIIPILLCKQSAVGQWLQHLCCYSTYKHTLDDEKGANRAQSVKGQRSFLLQRADNDLYHNTKED